MRGQVLTINDEGYDAARIIHNGMIDHRPLVIAQCCGAADVIYALECARGNGLPLSIRCGGHGVTGFAVCDAGVMIDLSRMNGVRVDPVRQTARAEGGATWGDFDHETQAFGLATTGGLVRTTGIAGLTLAGGHGFLVRRFGLACDNLISADVITADGRFLTASEAANPDLYWALRGGGGNFGVVTSFEYRLHTLGPVLGGLVMYPINRAAGFLSTYDDFLRSAPEELGALAVLGTLPDGTKAGIGLFCYSGEPGVGERLLAPIRAFGPPIADQVTVMPYTAVQSIVENFNPRGLRNYWKTVYMNGLPPEAIQIMVEYYAAVPAPHSHIVVYSLGGAVSRVADESTAVSHRGARHALVIIGMWENAAEDQKNIRWVRELSRMLQPFATAGFYPNYDADANPDQVVHAFGAEKYARLAAIKAKYDPANVFRLNQNIRPAEIA
jgi:FAD/FMN-containing dehydrogenase